MYPANTLVRIEGDEAALYSRCPDGNHYLKIQPGGNDECLGLSRAPLA